MSPFIFWTIIVLAIISLLVLLIVLFMPSGTPRHQSEPAPGVSIAAAAGSIVTVRKVGSSTRVDIRPDIHDHWEGDRDIDVAPTPIEITRSEEPELYAEYMSPSTSATRKYEIADYLYGIGLCLPFIPGLHQQWLREQEAAGAALPKKGHVNPATEETPVNTAGGATEGGLVMRRLIVDESLRHEPLPAMEPEEPADEPSPQEPDSNDN